MAPSRIASYGRDMYQALLRGLVDASFVVAADGAYRLDRARSGWAVHSPRYPRAASIRQRQWLESKGQRGHRPMRQSPPRDTGYRVAREIVQNITLAPAFAKNYS